jgi:hypothetical protein
MTPVQVHVIVTARQQGKTLIVPYNHSVGLQMRIVNGIRTGDFVVYEVPFYEILIEGGSRYSAVRFGLQNKGESNPPSKRTCDAGLSHSSLCTPSWRPDYSPHSFRGSSRPGAWCLLPGRGFLIHEGADTRLGQVGGSLGCIEILDGGWNGFLREIETLGGGTCSAIAVAHKLKVTIQSTLFPAARLVA